MSPKRQRAVTTPAQPRSQPKRACADATLQAIASTQVCVSMQTAHLRLLGMRMLEHPPNKLSCHSRWGAHEVLCSHTSRCCLHTTQAKTPHPKAQSGKPNAPTGTGRREPRQPRRPNIIMPAPFPGRAMAYHAIRVRLFPATIVCGGFSSSFSHLVSRLKACGTRVRYTSAGGFGG